MSVAGIVPHPLIVGSAFLELRGGSGAGLRKRVIRVRGAVLIEEEDVDRFPVAMAVFPMSHALANAGNSRAASEATIAITTSSSMSVKACGCIQLRDKFIEVKTNIFGQTRPPQSIAPMCLLCLIIFYGFDNTSLLG